MDLIAASGPGRSVSGGASIIANSASSRAISGLSAASKTESEQASAGDANGTQVSSRISRLSQLKASVGDTRLSPESIAAIQSGTPAPDIRIFPTQSFVEIESLDSSISPTIAQDSTNDQPPSSTSQDTPTSSFSADDIQTIDITV